MTRRDRGFTMVELMVVVAILGIVAAVAVGSYKRNPTGDDARRLASLMATAYRTAVGGGPVRADVAAAKGVKARAILRFTEESGGMVMATVYRIVEEDLPVADYQEVPVQTLALDTEVTLHAIADSAQISLATGSVSATAVDEVTKLYFPDGTAQAYTLYLKHKLREDAPRFRVVSLPLSISPQIFRDW